MKRLFVEILFNMHEYRSMLRRNGNAGLGIFYKLNQMAAKQNVKNDYDPPKSEAKY